MTKRLSILGSTGSIGRTCLAIAARQPEHFPVVALAAGNQWQLLVEQIRQFRPALVSVAAESSAEAIRRALGDECPQLLVGVDGLDTVATCPEADMVVSSLTGGVGVRPTVAAVRAGKDVALANKEAIVVAGEIIARESAQRGTRLFPVDSEISAIWQCLEAGRAADVKRVHLTASGGPFRTLRAEDFSKITPERALAHPTWVMGQKVTIDSATLMNKGFEILEVRWLFDMPLEKIEVLIHHQSIVHSLVEFRDGSLIAQLGVPDMTLPIQYALTYPERRPTQVKPLDLATVGTLSFDKPDMDRFPALALAREATKISGTMPAVLSGADETAVGAFLAGELPFTGIAALVEETMKQHVVSYYPDLETVLAAEAWARETAATLISDVAASTRAAIH
jgi:1-deoxy-D-xylulose-5-phosphate reductoisomerase